jgi:ankyrin repeat protein
MATKPAIRSWILLLVITAASAAGSDLRLIDAVRNGNTAAVRALLQERVDVNSRQPDGATALHWAVYRDDVASADLLIRAGANVNVANQLGATPVWLAAPHPNVAILERLVRAGANPNAALREGETPLMAASRSGNAAGAELLLAHGAEVNAKERSREQTALMWAVAERHPEVVRVLLENGADVHARSRVWQQRVYAGLTRNASAYVEPETLSEEAEGGFTPLLFAAENGALSCAKLLVAAGANVNDTAANGSSALAVATLSGNGALAAFLLDNGANPNAAGAGYTPLHAAILRSNLDLIRALLAHGADTNARLMKATPARRHSQDWAMNLAWDGASPFWLAARFADTPALRLLAANGADTRFVMKDGATPLMAAVAGAQIRDFDRKVRNANAFDRREDERQGLEAAKLLVDLGADVNACDAEGNTALHIAASTRFPTIVQFLAASGARLDAKNKRGETPLAVATKPRRPGAGGPPPGDDGGRSTVELLRKLGAVQ